MTTKRLTLGVWVSPSFSLLAEITIPSSPSELFGSMTLKTFEDMSSSPLKALGEDKTYLPTLEVSLIVFSVVRLSCQLHSLGFFMLFRHMPLELRWTWSSPQCLIRY